MLKSLENISDTDLIASLKSMNSSENEALAEIILYLSEVDSRKIYRELGHSSLFSYCIQALGYSESAAWRRIQVARCLKSNPEIYQSIRTGRLSFCALVEICKVKEEASKQELFKASEGKSKREVQVLTAKYQPAVLPKREVIKAKKVIEVRDLFSQESMAPTKEVFSITMEVDKDFMNLLDEVKAMIGHVPTSEVFRRTLKEFHSKRNVLKRKGEVKENSRTRYIPKASKLAVIEKDKGQCSFVSSDGRRCTEKHGLEIDHIKPYAIGGSRDVSNLRLLCKAHNLLMAEKAFGKDKIQQYFNL